MKTIEKSKTTSLLGILTDAINESIAMGNIKETDFITSQKVKYLDESVNIVTVINIPNIYPSDSVEHIEKNSSNFDRVVSDFTEFLIGPDFLLSETSYYQQFCTNPQGHCLHQYPRYTEILS